MFNLDADVSEESPPPLPERTPESFVLAGEWMSTSSSLLGLIYQLLYWVIKIEVYVLIDADRFLLLTWKRFK